MPEITFLPAGQTVSVPENTKILVAAVKHKIDIRFGCAACQCGTCGVAVTVDPEQAELSQMEPEEEKLLDRMGLATDGTVRLACRARIVNGKVDVDLSFQETYSPDQLE